MDTFNKVIFIIAVTLVVVAVLYAVISYAYFMKHEHFVCPSCKNAFKPKLTVLIFSTNAGPGKIIKCPNCGKKDYMEPVKDLKN